MANTTIRRIPTADEISGGASLRPTGANPGIDVTPAFRGAQDLAQGVDQLAGGIGAAGAELTRRQNVAEVSAADASWLLESNRIGSGFDSDRDWRTFDKRVTSSTEKARDAAAQKISDPVVRQAWLDQTELKRISLISAVNDKATSLKHDEQKADINASSRDLAKLYADPGTSNAVRMSIKKQIGASIDLGYKSGALSAAEAESMRYSYLQGADEQLGLNRARADLLDPGVDPQMVLTSMNVTPADAGGQGLISAAIAANNGKMPDIPTDLAKVTAETLGDANFPIDPKLARAYLSNPETASKYQSATVRMLSDRYKGDLTAVAVALQGGTSLADRWVKSEHDESILPASVRTRLRATMSAYRPGGASDRIPLRAVDGVDLEALDPAVLDRFEAVQTQFGQAVPLVHGDASAPLDSRSITLDTSNLDDKRKAQLIATASALGFSGIEIGKDTLTIDAGEKRISGPAGASVPPWAKDVAAEHMSAEGAVLPPPGGMTSDRYAGLNFDQRLQIAAEAKQEMKRRAVDQQASIETIAQNAPAAIAATGKYDGQMPTAQQFVQAYGSASEGIKKYQQFTAAVDTAKIMFGFRTESADQIMAQVAAAAPTSSGNSADLQSKQFDALSAAAQQTLAQRSADPAGYVLGVMPDLAKAYTSAQDGSDPAAFAGALQQMAVAQQKLGIDRPMLLPKTMAANIAKTFNDSSLPPEKRIGAIAGLITRTSIEGQQVAIFKQLIEAGVPEYTQGAMAALMRGDSGGAQNLMRATMVDPNKLAGALPAQIKPADIDAKIQEKIFNSGAIGDIVYGITDGSATNFERVRADSTLINRDVQMHLIDGSAGGSLDKAVDLTIKDMYGDVQTVVGNGVKITLPKDADPQPYRNGFAALTTRVRNALAADMQNGMVFVLGKDVDPVTAGMGDIIKFGVDNGVQQVMSSGYFINAGDEKYQFLNPYTGAVIAGDDGKPLTFSKADVLAAGAYAQSQPGNRFFPGMGGR